VWSLSERIFTSLDLSESILNFVKDKKSILNRLPFMKSLGKQGIWPKQMESWRLSQLLPKNAVVYCSRNLRIRRGIKTRPLGSETSVPPAAEWIFT